MIHYLKKIIQSQKKIYITMMSILVVLSSFEFVLLSIYSCFLSKGFEQIFLKLMPAIAIFVLFFLTLLMNNYFIENKNEELSIVLLSGSRTKEILEYIVIQFGLLFLISDISGFIIGIGFMELINYIQPYFFNYTIDSVLYVFCCLFLCKIIYVFLLNFSKFIRIKLNIADYISHHISNSSQLGYFSDYMQSHKNHRLPIKDALITIIGVLLIVMSIQGLFDNQQSVLLPVYFMFFLSGEIILINTTIPMIFDFLHDKKLLVSPKMIMVLANVINLSKILVSMVNILACVVPVCLSQFFIQVQDQATLSVTMICFYILLMMIFFSLVLRFQIYLPTIETDIATLKALGYRYDQLKSIYNGVVICFIFIVIFIPLILYIILLYRAYQLTFISLSMVFILTFSYFIIFTILAIYMLSQYHQTVKEAYNDVKYLNRSE